MNSNNLKQLFKTMKNNKDNLTIDIKLAYNQLDTHKIIYNNYLFKHSNRE